MTRALSVALLASALLFACKASEQPGSSAETEEEGGSGGVVRTGGRSGGGGKTGGGRGGAGSGGTMASGGAAAATGGTGGDGGASGGGGATMAAGGTAGADAGTDAAADGPRASDGSASERPGILGEGADYPGRPEVRICPKDWNHEQCCAFLCRCLNELCTDSPKGRPGIASCPTWCPKLSNMAMRCHVYHCFESVSTGGKKDHDSHCGHAADQVGGGMCRADVYN